MQLEATKSISMLMATRGRPELAFRSLKSLVETAHNADEIEMIIGIDNDDQISLDYFTKIVELKHILECKIFF